MLRNCLFKSKAISMTPKVEQIFTHYIFIYPVVSYLEFLNKNVAKYKSEKVLI